MNLQNPVVMWEMMVEVGGNTVTVYVCCPDLKKAIEAVGHLPVVGLRRIYAPLVTV
jgi:hypothetical protein